MNNISNITFLSNITKNAYTCFFNNSFLQFQTIDGLHYLVYSSKNNSIICFDLYKKKIITEIKKAGNDSITALRHYLDKKNKKDYIITNTPMNNSLRIWDIKNWQCIVYLNKIYKDSVLYSACLLNENNNNYILTSNCNYFGDSELIKVFDFNGNKIKEINDSSDPTLIIDTFFDKKKSKIYIVTGNKNYLKSFDYDKNTIYHKYYENYNGAHFSFIVDDKNKKDIIRLFDSAEDGIIRIWNFHTGKLLEKIKVSQQCLYEICLWNENNLIVACQDKAIKILDLSKNKIIKCLDGHNNYVITLKKINHIQYGECLISQGFENDQIKIWTFK